MKTHRHVIPWIRAVIATGLAAGCASAAFPVLKLEPVALQQFFSPTNITAAPDGSGRVFICDQPGKIHILQNGMIPPTPFLDVVGQMVPIGTNYSRTRVAGDGLPPRLRRLRFTRFSGILSKLQCPEWTR